MNAGKAVYGILSGTTAVTDIVGTRIFPEIAEQEAVTPFVIYQLQSVAPEDTHDGPSKLDEVRFEFLCYADSYNEAADLGVAVRGALDRVSGTYNGVNVESVQFNDVDVEIEYDPRRYSQVLKFTFRIKRDDIEIALGTPVTGAQLGDLSDVNVDGVTDNQILSYDAATDTWVPAADAGGANELSDLSDANVSLPSDGEVLIYSGGEFVNDNIAISNVTNLQSELDATPDSLDDLTDVKIVGTPQAGEALVYSSGFWQRGTAGASTLGDLTDVNTTGAGVGSLIQYNGASWDISAAELPSDAVYYHNRYASEAETLLDGATDTVELYYTAQADGDGLHEDAQTDTAQSGYDIRRKLYYAEKAQADPDTSGDWTQFADIADDTTYASAKATLLAYLKERTGGTVPISLKMTWEEVAEASLLLDTYTGAAAAYSLRQLRTAYTGDAIRVRRASDNTEQDIGFSAGELDTTSLASFCSGTNGFVKVWYDQSGNANDATQTTAANQPKIYDSSTGVVTENGKPAVNFDGSNDTLRCASAFSEVAYISAVYENNETAKNRTIIGADATATLFGSFYFQSSSSTIRVGQFARKSATTPTTDYAAAMPSAVASGTQLLQTGYISGSTIAVAQNGTLSTASINTSDLTVIGGQQSGAAQIGAGYYSNNIVDYTASKIQEIVVYDSDQSANRTNIEDNINTFYSIYP